MLKILASSYDNYIVHKLKIIIQNRAYIMAREDFAEVKKILKLSERQLFLLDIPLPTKAITANLREISQETDHRLYQFSFTSPHLSRDQVNNTAYGKFYQSKKNPHGPTVIVLPGWMTYQEEKYYSQPLGKMLLKAGINYIFYSTPYHLERRPRGVLSGELAVSGDLLRTLDFFRQAITETRTIIHWLKEEWCISRVGILGLSLGGWIGSHLLHLEEKVDFGILLIPAIDPAAIIWQTRIGELIQRDLAKQGLTQESYAQLVTPLNPANYQPIINPKKILVIKSKYDQCVPASSVDRFARSWENIRMREYREGHFSIILRKRPIREMIQFIRYEI